MPSLAVECLDSCDLQCMTDCDWSRSSHLLVQQVLERGSFCRLDAAAAAAAATARPARARERTRTHVRARARPHGLEPKSCRMIYLLQNVYEGRFGE